MTVTRDNLRPQICPRILIFAPLLSFVVTRATLRDRALGGGAAWARGSESIDRRQHDYLGRSLIGEQFGSE